MRNTPRKPRPCPLWLPVLLLPALLGACAAAPPPPSLSPEARAGRVETVRNELAVAVNPHSGAISAAERGAVVRALGTLGRDTATHVVVAGQSLERPARNAIVGLLGDAGVLAENVDFQPDQPGDRSGGTRLRLTSYVAVPPDCRHWGDIHEGWYENAPTAMLGCSTQRNLYLMLADPRDLLRGRDTVPADGARMAGSVQRYRADKVKKLSTENSSNAYSTIPATSGTQDAP